MVCRNLLCDFQVLGSRFWASGSGPTGFHESAARVASSSVDIYISDSSFLSAVLSLEFSIYKS